MVLEVPYLDGLDQEALSDRLVPANLYGLTVVRPAYTEGAQRLASITATKAVMDSGQAYVKIVTDNDADVCQDNGYFQGRSPKCETDGVYMCNHPGCVGIEGFGAYFAPTEQFIGHWNTFHVAFAVGYNYPEAACHHCSVPSPDSLDRFLRHIKTKHLTIWKQGRGEHLLTTPVSPWRWRAVIDAPTPRVSVQGLGPTAVTSQAGGQYHARWKL